MKFLHIGISCAALIALAGCSTLGADGKRIDYGAEAKQVPSLEIPPDLTVPGSDDRFRIPQGDGSASATFSDYSKGSTANPTETVLPNLQWVHLEREGTQRWLVVRDNPDNVWPVVKAFLLENGLTIRNEEPAAGIMETDWAENRALPSRKSSAIDTSVFDQVRAAGTRDQYIIRLERSKDGIGTGIYITHRGIVEEISDKGHSFKWKARANEPELEAIMLQRLMLRFGAGEAQAAIALEKASAVPTATPASTPDAVAEPAGTASLRAISGGSTIIVINDPFDRSWRKVGLAIEESSLAIDDKDREKGIYYLRPIKIERGFWDSMKFWKSDEDTDRQYRVNVKDGGAACEVTITDQDGAGNKASKQMLEALYKNINKQ